MQIYKFGGASIATPDLLRALLPIIHHTSERTILVISAIGKNTNKLEEIVAAACSGNRSLAIQLAQTLEIDHVDYARSLLTGEALQRLLNDLAPVFTELLWAIDDADSNRYDYSYDQIVCIGELLSTRIVAAFFASTGKQIQWFDARDIIRTDNTWRDAVVDQTETAMQAEGLLRPVLDAGYDVVTQGFIGATADNASVTLGREGSDYTAALLGAALQAKAVTIWKDVPGLLNADPKQFNNTVLIEAITYHEVIEMAYYGAQVIHPKTIKPLQNRQIPLYVKCFLDMHKKGTLIHNDVSPIFYPPLIVLKASQVLLQVTTRDFSFITEDNLKRLYTVLQSLRIRVNLIQNAAISFVACIDNREEQVAALIAALSQDYQVLSNEGVSLLTVRHYTPEVLADLTKSRYVLLEQKTRHAVQVVLK